MSGQVHVYTGDGKGKTTAALGLALRAVGAGWKVFFAQFAKGTHCSELTALERLADSITVRRYGREGFIIEKPEQADVDAARQGLKECREALASGHFSLVILDEAAVAVKLGLFGVEELIALIDSRPPETELVITGRSADPRLIDRADLVTEMHETKHYYRQGVEARVGIEK